MRSPHPAPRRSSRSVHARHTSCSKIQIRLALRSQLLEPPSSRRGFVQLSYYSPRVANTNTLPQQAPRTPLRRLRLPDVRRKFRGKTPTTEQFAAPRTEPAP